MDLGIYFRLVKPPASLAVFVDSFWMLENASDHCKDVVILPDGRIDLFFSKSETEPFHVLLVGLGTRPDQATVLPKTRTFAISFKPLAVEYVLQESVAALVDAAQRLPLGFWEFSETDVLDFDLFCQKASQKIGECLPESVDSRKQKLFERVYASHGSRPIKELSEEVGWSSRQINRYFRQQLGLPLKTYCDILRFRASFSHIKEGKLFPQQNFTDQSHFIKAVKKLSGALPKELRKNQNDRFIQFSTLDRH